jgi:iron(III) transport system ATP-binding protein
MVFQSYALFPHMTCCENVAYGLRVPDSPRPRSPPRREVRSWSAWPATSARLPSELSGGQQQRVAVARAIVLEPGCCCSTSRCPTWTPSCAGMCATRSATCSRRLGLTVVYVTHDQEEALAVSDRIVVMNNLRAAGGCRSCR